MGTSEGLAAVSWALDKRSEEELSLGSEFLVEQLKAGLGLVVSISAQCKIMALPLKEVLKKKFILSHCGLGTRIPVCSTMDKLNELL